MENVRREDLRKKFESLVDTILITGYNHADWEWTHSRAWHADRYALVFNEVLDIMDQDVDYKWYFDTENEELQPFVERYPSRVAELKRRVREGRIGIAGGTIINPQTPNIGGELFIRNMKYGRQYFEREFPDADLSVLALNDVIVGHSQLPQIIRKGGYKYFWFTRPEGALDAKGVPRDFFWEGRDGTRLLCSRCGVWAFWDIRWFPIDYKENWSRAFTTVVEELLRGATLLKSGILWVYEGMDDKRPLRGPSPWIPGVYPPRGRKIDALLDLPIDVLGFVQEWNRREKISMRFATPAEYFVELEERKSRLPTWKGILDQMAWVMMHGCKGYCPGNSQIEAALLRAEKICSIAQMLGEDYPEEELLEMWHGLLSISPHAIRYSYIRDYDELALKAEKQKIRAEDLTTSKMKSMARQVKTTREATARIVIFNELSWDRRDIVSAYIAFPEVGTWRLTITDNQGREVPYQITKWVPYGDGSLSEGEIIFLAEAPSLGYSTYYVSKLEGKPDEVKPAETPKEIETPFYRIRLRDGGIESLYAKTLERELLRAKGVLGNDILFYQAEGMRDFRPGILNGAVEKVKCADTCLIEDGPVRKRIVVRGDIGGEVKVNREISIYDELPRIDFLTHIHAPKGDGTLRAQFPLTFEGKLVAGIPFGAEERDLSREPLMGGERHYGGYEHGFYVMGWLDIMSSNENYGVAVLPLVKDLALQGFSLDPKRKVVEHTLLTIMTLPNTGWLSEMSPKIEGHDPDEFAYSLYPHSGDWRKGEVYRRALEYQKPLRAFVVTGENNAPELPDRQSFLSLNPSNLVLSSLYREGKRLVVRFYEQCGTQCEAEIALSFSIKKAAETDFNGKPVAGKRKCIKVNQNKISLLVKAWEIVTLEITEAD